MTTDLARLGAVIEEALGQVLPATSEIAPELVAAMRYASLGGGKRIRPLLTLATAAALDGRVEHALPSACAVELVHAYSLVHDDLPAMDDDDLRRGRPTCHVAFDEATAILVGDALQALAFELIAGPPADTDTSGPSAEARLQMVRELSRAAGWGGMVGGQALDILATNRRVTLDELEALHGAKTGALITAAVMLGAIAGGGDGDRQRSLRRFGQAIGLAFQVVDDVLDVTQSTEALGKRAGADAVLGKSTYPSLMGVAAASAYADELLERARGALAEAGIGDGALLSLAETIVRRDR